MKNLKLLYLAIFAFTIFISCSEEEKKLELYSPEAFAFQLENEWELNATAQIKGFQQIEEEGSYSARLSYYANLITPSGEKLEEVDYGLINRNSEEEMIDTQLELQIILDDSFNTGEYTLEIFVVDDLSEQQASANVDFKLSE